LISENLSVFPYGFKWAIHVAVLLLYSHILCLCFFLHI
jgi:hypothetical protein